MQLTIQNILKLTGGKLIKTTPEVQISGVSSLNEACCGDASFLGNEKYFQDFLTTKASLVLVPPSLPAYPEGPIFIEVPNPSMSFNALVEYFKKAASNFIPGIHPQAIVSPSAQINPEKVRISAGCIIEDDVIIGDGSDIAAGCYIGQGCKLGENCKLYPRVTIRERCLLGNQVVIQPGAVIGSDGFGFLLNAETGYYDTVDQLGIVEIGDNVDIGANTTIDRARFGRTIIGTGCKIDNLCQIGHNVIIGEHCIIVAQSGIAGSSTLGKYVIMAAQCGIAGHLKIGDNVKMAAKTATVSNLAANKSYWGFPADDYMSMSKQFISLRRLPNAIKEIRTLKKQIEKLEQTLSDTKGK